MATRSVKVVPAGVRHLRSLARRPQVLKATPSGATSVEVSSSLHSSSQPLALGLRASAGNYHRLMSTATSSLPPKKKPKEVNITFIGRNGEEQTVKAKVGDTLLEVAKEFDIEVEGACEGTLSCSTCHMIVEPERFSKIPDPLTEEEQDMLDLACGVTDTSRLGCQILVSEDLEGIRLNLPESTRDARNT